MVHSLCEYSVTESASGRCDYSNIFDELVNSDTISAQTATECSEGNGHEKVVLWNSSILRDVTSRCFERLVTHPSDGKSGNA